MNTNIDKLNIVLEKNFYYDSLSKIIQWDTEMNMPREAISNRNKIIETIAKKKYELIRTEEFNQLIKELKFEPSLNKKNQAIVRNLEKELEFSYKISDELLTECSVSLNECMIKWREAKKRQDYSIVEPYLNNILQLNQKVVECLGYGENLYDTMLDTYEPGLTVDKMDSLADELLTTLVPMRIKLENSQNKLLKTLNFEKGIDVNIQEQICHQILSYIGFDFNKGYICKDEVPSCTIINNNDVRLTNFYGKRIMEVIWGCLHEVGHGLYGQNIPDDIITTPIGRAPSTGFDEAQGKLFENIIGKDKNFWTFFYPKFQKNFDLFQNITLEEFYKLINSINISPIRLEADELTFNLHIIIRYEIEKSLINDKLKSKEIKKIWEEKYKKYLGIIPENDSQGILQDFHWFSGKFGYFPTYILANLYSAQIFYTMKKQIPNLLDDIQQGKFYSINNWLSENIYRYGSLYNSQELIMNITGEELTAKYYIDYLNSKYQTIYDI